MPASVASTAGCASWCHWEVARNCKSAQCMSCGQCVQQQIGRPACVPLGPADVMYEDCAPSCKKGSCRSCRCKFCLSCGGPPPREAPRDGCPGKSAVSFDLSGRMELSLDRWVAGSFVTLEASDGLSFESLAPAAHYAKASAAGEVGRAITVQLLPTHGSDAPPIRLTYSGAGPFLEPTIRCSGTPAPPLYPRPPRPPPSPHAPHKSPPPPVPAFRVVFRHPPPPPIPPRHATSPPKATVREGKDVAHATPCDEEGKELLVAPAVVATSSASWALRLPRRGLPPCGAALLWEARMQRGAEEVVFGPVHSREVSQNGSLVINSARCPPVDFPEGCTFSVRSSQGGVTTGWSPPSDPVASARLPLLPEGGARFEVLFAREDLITSQWDGSLAERFQSEASKQMAVSPTSFRILERYARGRYMTFDLLPIDLSIEPLTSRLVAAMRGSPEMHVSELRRLTSKGRADRIWHASGDTGKYSGPGMGTLGIVVLLPAAMCTMLGLSAKRQQRETALALVARDMPPMHRGFQTPSYARVCYAPECGSDDPTEVTLPLSEIRSVAELERTIVKQLPSAIPPNAELLIAFQERTPKASNGSSCLLPRGWSKCFKLVALM
ncbi:hypothetical protein AB1Y20_008002 [Prymnesium parvum]|uniref:Uncharacterized protein n=1 Tax=Prymnesium parvum TaxID=97485 RepID=A0AB34IU95_PRYPA